MSDRSFSSPPRLRCPRQATGVFSSPPIEPIEALEWAPNAWAKAHHGETRLEFLLFTPTIAPEAALSVFLDPAGDGEAYFEIGVTTANLAFSRAARRSRSGLRVDSSWPCEGLRTSTEVKDTGWTATFSIPFASLGSIPPGPDWKVAFQNSTQKSFRPARRFIPLDFEEA